MNQASGLGGAGYPDDKAEDGKGKLCAKCGETHTYQASKCEEPYPNFDKQVCDECLENDHEFVDCKSKIGNPCDLCGHGDHKKRKCPFLSNGKIPNNLSANSLNQFTPNFRERYLAAHEMMIPPAINNPTSPTLSSQDPAVIKSPPTSPRSSQSGLQSLVKGAGALTLGEVGDPMTARRKKWAEAEKKMPRRQNGQSQSSKHEKIKANFFEITIDPKVKLCKYSITLGGTNEKDSDSSDTMTTKDGEKTQVEQKDKRKLKRETKRFLIDGLLKENPPPHKYWATDYDSIIVSRGPLYEKSTLSVDQVTQTHHYRTGRGKDPKQVIVESHVTYLGEINLQGLKNHVERISEFDNISDVLKSLNIISWKTINGEGFQGGRVGNRFYPLSMVDSNETKRETPLYRIRDGFFSSMRPGDGSLLLNVNTVTSAFFSPINLQTWMEKQWPGQPDNKVFRSKLKNVRVTFDLHNPSRIWTICGLGSMMTSGTTFRDKKDNNKEKSVFTYLKNTYREYQWTEKDRNASCINVGSQGREIWYPATQLTIVDWQIVREKMQEDYSAQMLKKGEKRPQQNKDSIRDVMGHLGLEALSFYQSFGLKPTLKLVELNASTLGPPKLLFNDTKDQKTATINNGAWNLAEQSSFLKRGVACTSLNVINLTGQADLEDSINIILKEMVRYSLADSRIAINVSQPAVPPSLPHSKPSSQEVNVFDQGYRQKCRKIFDETFSSLNQDPSEIPFMLVVLPKRDIPLYSEIKHWGDCEVGTPTVCITNDKLKKVGDATLRANICLKINSKLKGVSHKIAGSVLPTSGGERGKSSGARKNTMIIGADVTHPKEGHQHSCPSMAGVVATDQDDSSCYLGSARLQKGKEEHIVDLGGMMKERVIAWYNKTKEDRILKTASWKGRVPTHLLFYRDGVSESQYGMVLDEEKDQIFNGCRQAFEEIKKDSKNNKFRKGETWMPKLTLLVVTKRHHARFFPHKELRKNEAGDKKIDFSLTSGKVIDTKVVDPIYRDFYLQSHHSGLGTARSGHYVVLYDDNNYTLLELQQITNNLCYTSARATKAVSVCIPARYADLLCDRLRCYMKPALDGLLNDDKDERKPVGYSKQTTSPQKKSSPRPSVSAPADTSEDLSYIKAHEEDSRVWKAPRQTSDTRKNPWSAALDKCMFYV